MNDEPPLWETPGRLYGIEQVRTAECDDAERPAGMSGNPAHLLLATEDALYAMADKAIDLAGDVLGVRAEGAWRWQRPFFRSLLRRFFSEGSDAPGWLEVIPLRMPHQHRFEGTQMNTAEFVGAAELVASASALRHASLDLGYGIGQIDAGELLLAYPGADKKARPYLLEQERQRRVSYGESLDTLLYLGHPGADRDHISQAHIPAISAYYDPALRMLRTTAITVGKLTLARPVEVTQLIATLQPEEGRTVALVSGQRSLRTYLLQYPLDRSLLQRGAKR